MSYILIYVNKSNQPRYFSNEPKFIFTNLRRLARKFASVSDARNFSIPSMYDNKHVYIIDTQYAPENITTIKQKPGVELPLMPYLDIEPSPPQKQPIESVTIKEPAMPNNESLWPGLPPGEPTTTVASFNSSSSQQLSELYSMFRTIRNKAEEAMEYILGLSNKLQST